MTQFQSASMRSIFLLPALNLAVGNCFRSGLLVALLGFGLAAPSVSAAPIVHNTKIGWDVQGGGDGSTMLGFPGAVLPAFATWNFTDSDMAAGTIVDSTGTVINGVGTARFGATWSNWGTVVNAPESNLVTQDYLFDVNGNDVDGHHSRLDITGLPLDFTYRVVVHSNRIQNVNGGTTDGATVTIGASSVVLPAGTGMNAAWPDGGFAAGVTSADFVDLSPDGSGTIRIYFDKIGGGAVILTGFELEAFAPVPEPSTGAVCLLGLAGLMLRRRRRGRAREGFFAT